MLSQATEANKAQLESELKTVITEAFENKTTWTTDWDNKVLPALEASEGNGLASSNNKLSKQSSKTQGNVHNMDPQQPLMQKKKTVKELRKQKKGEKRSSESLGQPSPSFGKPVIDSHGVPVADEGQLEKRQKRFEKEHEYARLARSNPKISEIDNVPLGPVIGRCTDLEKRYLRLTSAPDPDKVRPERILKQTLALLKKKWISDQNYSYICDQFKSMRQDLTVQHIENEFTVEVYEIHARIALEKGDLGEYNQCQSRLRELYSKNIKGHENEFLAYRILYLLHTQARADLSQILLEMAPEQFSDKNIKHALDVNRAVMTNNFSWLFHLYLKAPNMGGYVMDNFIPRARLLAMTEICKAYRPEVPLDLISKELGFESDQEVLAFLDQFKLGDHLEKHTDSRIFLKTKESWPIFEQSRQQAFRKVDIKGQI